MTKFMDHFTCLCETCRARIQKVHEAQNLCLNGYNWGADNDSHNECSTCKDWGLCSRAKEEGYSCPDSHNFGFENEHHNVCQGCKHRKQCDEMSLALANFEETRRAIPMPERCCQCRPVQREEQGQSSQHWQSLAKNEQGISKLLRQHLELRGAVIRAEERCATAFRALHAAILLEMVMLGVDGNKLYTFYQNDHIGSLVEAAQRDYAAALENLDLCRTALSEAEKRDTV